MIETKQISNASGQNVGGYNSSALGDYWPGIQLYYPPVKYAPSLGLYEDMEQASARMKKHAHNTIAHTLVFDLEDGCRQKEMSRNLLRHELPELRKVNERVTIAIRCNSFTQKSMSKTCSWCVTWANISTL